MNQDTNREDRVERPAFVEEIIWAHENVDPGTSLDARRAIVRSRVYRNGEPMVCLSCAAQTDLYGNLPCGH